jgi:hypothetical protein
MLDNLVDLALNARSEQVRALSSVAVLDRAYGKPTQPSEVQISVIERLSLEDQRRLAEALIALQGHGPGAVAEMDPLAVTSPPPPPLAEIVGDGVELLDDAAAPLRRRRLLGG